MNAVPDTPRRHRLSVTDYFRMVEVGILAEDARVELIDGEIIDMPPIGSPHAGLVNRLTRLLVTAVGERAIVSVQNPIILGTSSAPEPDLCLLAPRADDYASSHPLAEDVPLAIEVADSSLAYDRDVKTALYARHGIAEVWLVEVGSRRLNRYRGIDDNVYRDVSAADIASPLIPRRLPDVGIDLSPLF